MLALHFAEVEVVLASQKQVVEVLGGAGLLEGENAMHNDKKYNAEGEHVDLLALVGLALLDLGSHVCEGASEALEIVNQLVGCISEVHEFKVEVGVDEDVLEFEVAVHNLLAVDVLKCVQHLCGEVAASVLSHRSEALARVE